MSVSKTVTGKEILIIEDFNFGISIYDGLAMSDIASINYVITDSTGASSPIAKLTADHANKFAFALKHGETIKFLDIPITYKFQVTEIDANKGGYQLLS